RRFAPKKKGLGSPWWLPDPEPRSRSSRGYQLEPSFLTFLAETTPGPLDLGRFFLFWGRRPRICWASSFDFRHQPGLDEKLEPLSEGHPPDRGENPLHTYGHRHVMVLPSGNRHKLS